MPDHIAGIIIKHAFIFVGHLNEDKIKFNNDMRHSVESLPM